MNHKTYLIFLLFLLAFTVSNAQKLPKLQVGAMAAPDAITIDGTLNEWGQLKAYNPNNRLFYSIANSNDYIFVAIAATDPNVIDKMMKGGIAFSVTPFGQRKLDAATPSIIFPYRNGKEIFGVSPYAFEYAIVAKDSIRNRKRIDTLYAQINSAAAHMMLTIRVKNMGTDSVLALKNKSGINAAIRFTPQMACCVEIGIPLKLLNLTASNSFEYNVRLEGPGLSSPGKLPPPIIIRDDNRADTLHDYDFIDTPTSFWGTYKLVK